MATPLKAIREKCMDCSGGSYKEARLCPCEKCSLWPFRFGRRPQKTNDEGYVEFKPRKKENAIWGIRTSNWAKVVYVFLKDGTYIVGNETFRSTATGLKLAKQKAIELIKEAT